ncbi:MAG: hypothetical protein CMJ19_25180 [Phycisphaeraceae bacterium]|nr:hypothetical protein [Phycisphaeraceae bacterium]
MNRKKAFTLIELLVVISIISLLIAILLPALGSARLAANRIKSATQLRGIHQGMIVHAQGNKGYFPGLQGDGLRVPDGAETTGNNGNGESVEARYWIMLNQNLFPASYITNPVENRVIWTGDTPTIAWENYSYAMLDIRNLAVASTGVLEWRDQSNGEAPMLCDRNIGLSSITSLSMSVYSQNVPGAWEGNVVWGDNHVDYQVSPLLRTRIGGVLRDEGGLGLDNIFGDNLYLEGTNTEGAFDAHMIHRYRSSAHD